MLGYPRPAPAFRWYNWWANVALMDAERDDDALLEAEDAAIRAAESNQTPDDAADLAALTEILTDAGTTPLHEDAEDHGGPRG